MISRQPCVPDESPSEVTIDNLTRAELLGNPGLSYNEAKTKVLRKIEQHRVNRLQFVKVV